MTSDPFSPTAIRPVQPATPIQNEGLRNQSALNSPVPSRKPHTAKPAKRVPRKASAKRAPRKAKAAKPKFRRSRVAAISIDATAAFNVMAGMKKGEIATVSQVVTLLNPLARPARRRVMDAVGSILE